MDQRYTNDTTFSYYKDLDENLAWLTKKTEEPKCNKGHFTLPLPLPPPPLEFWNVDISENNMSTDMKLSRSPICKIIQSGGFLG